MDFRWCLSLSVLVLLWCVAKGIETGGLGVDVRFPGEVSPPKAAQPPPRREAPSREDLDSYRYTTTEPNISDGGSGDGGKKVKAVDKKTDSESVELMEEDVKGAPGSKLVSRIVNNQNGMQRKQDVVFDLNGNRQNLGLNPVKMLEHATVQVNPQSTLVAPPGTMVNVYFDVTNNLNIPVLFTFRVEDRHNLIRGIQPIQRRIESLRTEIVTVMVETRMGAPEVDLITFIAHLGSVETVGRKAIFRIGEPVSDTTGPDIDYSYNGDCRDAWTPQTCSTAVWGADITVSDTESGLLRVSSFPLGLQYRGDFVAGTRDNVYLHYSASCCDTKVDVIATDLKGNTYKRTINVERQWWTAAEISALVLGIILLLLLLGLVIAGIITCCRNRGSRDFTR